MDYIDSPAKEYFEVMSGHDESFQSVADELGEDESISIRNITDRMAQTWKNDIMASTPSKRMCPDANSKIVPVIVAKPSKSVLNPPTTEEKGVAKSNICASESTRTDKNGKESFDSYSTKHIIQPIHQSSKKPGYKPPFFVGPKKRTRKYSNEISIMSKSNYYCSSNKIANQVQNSSAFIKFKQSKRQSAKFERRDKSPTDSLARKHKNSIMSKNSG